MWEEVMGIECRWREKVLGFQVLYCTVLYCTVPYVPYHIVLYCTVQYRAVPYCTVSDVICIVTH